MIKRIVSGIFILTALGALGVILAGAMTSGEQLIVRFLTAVTVAALALYVVSDLRLQSEEAEALPASRDRRDQRPAAPATTAVMATVTGSYRITSDGVAGDLQSTDDPTSSRAGGTTRTAPNNIDRSDPTEAVTGSRLVPSLPSVGSRVVPPHPSSGTPTVDEAGRTPPTEQPDTTPGEPLPALVPVTGPPAADLESGAEPVDGRPAVSASTSDDDPATSDDYDSGHGNDIDDGNDTVIARTSFTYSGKLSSNITEWPPRSPDPYSAQSVGDESTTVKANDVEGSLDALTAELPAMPDEPMPEEQGGSVVHLFAVDTLEDVLADARANADAAAIGTDGHGSAGEPVVDLEDDESGVPPTTHPSIERQLAAARYASPIRPKLLDLRQQADRQSDTIGSEADPTMAELTPVGAAPPVAPSTPDATNQPAGQPDRLTAAIRSGELQVINSLISQGMLSTGGPITDRDVRTMVYVAFTSNELRKLILAGGTPDGIRAGDLDLGPVELFDETRYAPAPKRLYSGAPALSPGGSTTVLDLTTADREPRADSVANDDSDSLELLPSLPAPKNLYRKSDAEIKVEP